MRTSEITQDDPAVKWTFLFLSPADHLGPPAAIRWIGHPRVRRRREQACPRRHRVALSDPRASTRSPMAWRVSINAIQQFTTIYEVSGSTMVVYKKRDILDIISI